MNEKEKIAILDEKCCEKFPESQLINLTIVIHNRKEKEIIDITKMDERYAQILQLLESFKAESADEVSKLRKENEELKQQIQNLCKSGSKMQAARSSMTYSAMAMADVHRMAKDPELMDKISENSDANDGSGNFDGMDLTASVAVDPSKSSYATGYNYNLLKSSEVLVTMHDVGDANKDIDNGMLQSKDQFSITRNFVNNYFYMQHCFSFNFLSYPFALKN